MSYKEYTRNCELKSKQSHIKGMLKKKVERKSVTNPLSYTLESPSLSENGNDSHHIKGTSVITTPDLQRFPG